MTTDVALSDINELVRIERGAPEAVFGGNYGLDGVGTRQRVLRACKGRGDRLHPSIDRLGGGLLLIVTKSPTSCSLASRTVMRAFASAFTVVLGLSMGAADWERTV